MPTLRTGTSAPWSFFEPHLAAPFPFFMDRASGGGISFAGSRPSEQLRVSSDGRIAIWRGGEWHHSSDDPFESIDAFIERNRAHPVAASPWLDAAVLPRVVGYLAYELASWADTALRNLWRAPAGAASGRARSIGTPLAVLSRYDSIDAWDPESGRSVRVALSGPAPGAGPPPVEAVDYAAWRATSREEYRRGFDRIHEAIAAGDIYQANLSRRAVFHFDDSAARAYATLRSVQPVPWGSYLDFGGFALLSNSPECFLVRRGQAVLTRPIKGTRSRGADANTDAGNRRELRADPKEMAEHLMIVDLERNDLGRVAQRGTVEVTLFADVETFATLHHMVSEVRATLHEDTRLADLLRATFPGGSITGAPKIRAMEILAEVEPTARGPYTGAIGFFNGGDAVELSIAIRTAVAAGERMLYSTGGGIVADSDPDREWAETELKVAALREALTRRHPAPHSTADNCATPPPPDPPREASQETSTNPQNPGEKT